jgi:hypothetical protein
MRGGGAALRSLFVNGSQIFTEADFSGGPTISTNECIIIGYSQPAGTSACTYHYFDGATWTHQAGPINAPSAVAVDEVWLGRCYGTRASGDGQVLGIFGSALSNAAIEAVAMDLQLQAWVDLGAIALWPLNQALAADPVTDVTTFGADQNSIIGSSPTVVVDPCAFDYTLDTGGGEPGGGTTITISLMNFGPIVTGIAACACDGLDTAGIPVCSCLGATIGPPAWDRCDCVCSDGSGATGQLAAYSGPIFPSQSFPAVAPPDRFDTGCGPGFLVANINVEIARCTPSFGINGELPTPAQLQAAAIAWHNDATIVRQAVGCCLVAMKAAGTIRRYYIGATTPIAEQGGCAGSTLALQVALGHCICP